MFDFPDHPDIAAALATGYPAQEDYGLFHCEQCGAPIREDDPYYLIGDRVLCPDCVEEMKRYA